MSGWKITKFCFLQGFKTLLVELLTLGAPEAGAAHELRVFPLLLHLSLRSLLGPMEGVGAVERGWAAHLHPLPAAVTNNIGEGEAEP